MADIKAFKGLHAKLENPEDLGKIAAPPYDMLNEKIIDDLYSLDEHNTVRIIQNKPQESDSSNKDRHKRAATLLEQWTKEGSFVQDNNESLYIYRQTFTIPVGNETKTFERTGITVLIKLTSFDEGVVLPHEKTLSGPKQDRLDLLEAIKTNTGQLFGLAADDGRFYESIRKAPTAGTIGTFTDMDNVCHEMLKISDPEAIANIRRLLADKTIVIADGHHRYETALNYSRMINTPSSDYVMMTLVSMADPGLVIRPFHRLVKRVEKSAAFKGVRDLATYFTVTDLGEASFEGVADFVASTTQHEMLFVESSSKKLFGLAINEAGKNYLSGHSEGQSNTWLALSVSQINKLCVEGLMQQPLDGHVLHDVMDYINDSRIAYDSALDADRFIGCFFIHPVTINTVMDIVSGGERMPQKSTNFFPKLYSGLVFNKLDSE